MRSVLLSGNGTLLINNTFVGVGYSSSGASRQAFRSSGFLWHAQQDQAFSSLLIHTEQETTTPVPTQVDSLGSYVDLEVEPAKMRISWPIC
jgi:hypothetical protein